MIESARPTGVRWNIVGLMMAYTAFSHFNRISMSVAGTEQIMPHYHVSETQMGLVYSAYLLAYTLCMTPGGWLIDWAGPRRAMILMGAGAAVLVSLTGAVGLLLPAASVVVGLFGARALLGAINAPLHPGAARVVSFWMPPKLHSWGNGLVIGAALVGIALTYPIFGGMIDRFGWPTAFLLSGAATGVLALTWTLYSREPPSEHPGVNAAELALIAEGRRPAASHPKAHVPWTDLLKNRDLMILTTSYAAVGYVEYLFYYWVEHYFKDVLHLTKETSRSYSMITSLSMAAGMMLGGWLADRLCHHVGGKRGRAIVPIGGMLLGAALVVLGVMTNNPTAVVAFFALGMAAIGATEGPFWTTAIELGGTRGGTSAALLNTGGNIGGLFAPVITPILAKPLGWQGSIVLAAAISVLGASLWRWIDPTGRAGALEEALAEG